LELIAGEEKVLQASVEPNDATIRGVLWRSENPAVATVDGGGRVSGVSAGTTEIVVISKDGYYKTSCAVTVTD
ncbi:MAG: Ig-like domain-containing protein, partial [Clostridiales bacterium]|nr:Ig-like domain-containing protein [Clostridiales bacterium]